MKQKIIAIIFLIAVGIIGIFFLSSPSVDVDVLSETFFIDAIFYESEGFVEIIFKDNSQKTSYVILEILGMETSYQKIFSDSEFVERVEFLLAPSKGWILHPITLVIIHDELGSISMKTEIHASNETKPAIIYGQGPTDVSLGNDFSVKIDEDGKKHYTIDSRDVPSFEG